jgi:hypothetical protein
MSRRCFRYSLRSLLLVTTAAAIIAAVLVPQLKGRLQREGDPGFFTDSRHVTGILMRSGVLPSLVFVCATEGDAQKLNTAFDRDSFYAMVVSAGSAEAPPVESTISALEIRGRQFGTCFLVEYDFAHWGRYRLDAQHMRYVFDGDDPVAKQRNAAVHCALKEAGRKLAEENPAIVEWSAP